MTYDKYKMTVEDYLNYKKPSEDTDIIVEVYDKDDKLVDVVTSELSHSESSFFLNDRAVRNSEEIEIPKNTLYNKRIYDFIVMAQPYMLMPTFEIIKEEKKVTIRCHEN